VSRGTVREALRAIATHGIIERSAGLGYFVREWIPIPSSTRSWFLPCWPTRPLSTCRKFRAILEVHAISLAVDRATPEDLKALEDNVAAIAREPDFGIVALKFHELLVAAAHNPVLDSLYRVVVRGIENNITQIYQPQRTQTQRWKPTAFFWMLSSQGISSGQARHEQTPQRGERDPGQALSFHRIPVGSTAFEL